jgi:hypothetical protein
MYLPPAYIQAHEAMAPVQRLNLAIRIHKQLQANIIVEPEIIDLPLRQEARMLHEFFYSYVPNRQFRAYVKAVHSWTGYPNWLCGYKGVAYAFV